MASITYKPDEGDPQETKVFGKTFKAGEAVEVNDPLAIRKAQGNRFFEVGGLNQDEKKQVEVVGGFQDANSGEEVQLVRRPRLPAYGTPDTGPTGPTPPSPATQGSAALKADAVTTVAVDARDGFQERFGGTREEVASGEYDGAPQYRGPQGTEGAAKRGPGRPPRQKPE